MILILVFAHLKLASQTFVSQDFSVWPPPGWAIENQNLNWSSEFSVQAGGQPPEARLSGSPYFFNMTRLISPSVNLSGIPTIRLEFNYMADVVAIGFTLGVASRTGNGPWQTLWSTTLNSSTACICKDILINNTSANQDNFQFCFYFSGNSQNLNAWYIDDIRLFVPPQNDIELVSFLSPLQYSPGASIVPTFVVRNLGLQDESNVTFICHVLDSSNNVVFNADKLVQNISSGETDTISFPPYTLSHANSQYQVRLSVSQPGDNNNLNDSLKIAVTTYEHIDKKYVLLELGTVTWCTHCPPAAVTVENMIASGKQLAVIAYHGAYGDPFNNPVSNNRLSYYNILGFPTALFDGVLRHTGSSSSNALYPDLYQQRADIKTPFDLKVYGNISNNDVSLNVIIRKAAPLTNTNLVLRAFVTESNIPHNWQNLNQVHHVARLNITANAGYSLDLVNNAILNIPMSFSKNAAWNIANFEVIAFIQDTLTKEVFQVDKVSLSALAILPVQNISGFIRYDNQLNSPLGGVTVKLMLGPSVINTTTTDNFGYYIFNNLLPGAYTLRCTSSHSWGGSNSVDALLILRHFTGIDILNPLRITAGDIDASSNVNAVDALNISKRFVGLTTTYSKGDWIFDNPAFTVAGYQDMIINIKGICRGDVNGSYIP